MPIRIAALLAVLINAAACADLTAPVPRQPDAAHADVVAGTGDVYIMLQTDPHGIAGAFSFTHDFGSNSSPQVASPFTLTDGQLKIFNSVVSGSYTLSLTALSGWKLAASGDGYDTGCFDDQGNSTIDLNTGVATIDVAAGGFVVCTFVVTEHTDPPEEPGEPEDPPAPSEGPPLQPRGVGYWKHVLGCSSNGGRGSSVLLLNNAAVYPVGLIESMSCAQAANLLAKQDLDGNNKPGDAAYHLAAQLLTARLNQAAGVVVPACVEAAMAAAQELLDDIGFTGMGDYLGPRTSSKSVRSQASALAELLGLYNDGNPAVCG